MVNEIENGWYAIGEEWDLFIDGELKDVHVEYINIESRQSDYKVTHYGPVGNKITTLSLTKDDILPKINSKECQEKPDFI